MRIFKLMLVVVMSSSFVCFAENSTPVKENPVATVKDNPVDTIREMANPPTKKERRTKVLMCGECGKPENECECKDHKKEEKKK